MGCLHRRGRRKEAETERNKQGGKGRMRSYQSRVERHELRRVKARTRKQIGFPSGGGDLVWCHPHGMP